MKGGGSCVDGGVETRVCVCVGGDREMRMYTLFHAYCISFHVQKCNISFSLQLFNYLP